MDLNKIARSLEREICHVHNKYPTATPEKDKISLNCCCDDFKDRLVNEMENEIRQAAENDIIKMFKRVNR